MNTSEKLRKDADAVWKKLVEHPFVVELYKGDLPLEKFKYYILQDYHYLIAAIKNFSIIASKAPSVKTMREVIDILYLEAKSEFDGYEELLKGLGYTIKDAAKIDPIPVNVSYSSYLLSTSLLQSYGEAMAAVLPCFWSYAEIANHHLKKLNANKVQLYKDWGKVYITDEYQSMVEKIKSLVDEAGEISPYERMKKVFIASSNYELMFWEAVYNQQDWPINFDKESKD